MTLKEFLSGQSVTYLGFDGLPYKARYVKSAHEPAYLDIRHASTGKVALRPISGERDAVNFYHNVEAAVVMIDGGVV